MNSAPTTCANLRRLLDAHAGARPGGPRDAVERALRGANAEAIANVHGMHTLLEKQWAWLGANAEHAKADEREAAFLANLADYEALESAIGETEARLGIDAPRARSWSYQGDAFVAWRARWQDAMVAEEAAV